MKTFCFAEKLRAKRGKKVAERKKKLSLRKKSLLFYLGREKKRAKNVSLKETFYREKWSALNQ